MNLVKRLEDMNCHYRVEQIVDLELMYQSDYLHEFVMDNWDYLPEAMKFTDEQKEWLEEFNNEAGDGSYYVDGDYAEFLWDIEFKKGLLFQVSGRLYKKPGQFTSARIFEIGYAPSYDKLHQCINEVLDKIELELVEE